MLAHVDSARAAFDANATVSEKKESPFDGMTDPQHGIQPGLSEAPTSEHLTPQPTPNLRGSPLRGTAAELRMRRASMHLHEWGRPAPPTNLRGTLNKAPESYVLTPELGEGAEEPIDEEDSDFLEGLASHTTEQRLMALEQYVFITHAKQIFTNKNGDAESTDTT